MASAPIAAALCLWLLLGDGSLWRTAAIVVGATLIVWAARRMFQTPFTHQSLTVGSRPPCRGHDHLTGGNGNDRLSGGPGRDRLRCGGSGTDRAVATSGDCVSRSCERPDPGVRPAAARRDPRRR